MASQSAINVLEVCRVLRNVVRPVLHTVFCWGCERDTTKTLEEYLVNEKKMSKQNFKDHFNKAMIEIIRSDPSGDKFDICLLYACIRTACKNLAKAGSQVWTNEDETKLEYLCTALKNLRGEIIHNVVGLDEIEMKNCISNINNLTTRALDIAGTLYNKDRTEVQDVIKHMKEIITNISENPLICNQDDMYKELLESRGDNRDKIMKEGIKELRYQFLRLKSVDPVSWFTESQLSVEAVFTLLDVVKENHQLIHQEAVKYEQLLILETENGSIPSVLIVEGEAGAGKTTLARLLMREWAWLPEKRPTFFNLNTIDIILYFECRNKHISKFEDLLLVLVSNAACQMSNSDLIKSVLNMHVLIIADGLDEGNNNTDLLLSEIKTLIPISGNKLRILITTRPEKLYKLSILIGNVQRVHTRLTGISYKKRVEFVKKLHEEMISQNHSKQDTQGLVDFLQQSQARIGDHCRSPFMLTLLTYLWAVDPLQVNEVTTSTKLYTKLLNMLQRRLLGKLMNLNMETEEFLKTVIEKFLYVLYEVSLRTLLTGDVVLSSDCCEKIVHVCEDHRLPTEDMCAAFLAIDRQWTANGYKIFFTAPHKSIMEYYASLHVFHYIFPPKGDSFECELTELLTKYGKSLEEVREHLSIAKSFKKKVNIKECIEDLFQLGDENRILSDYQNVLIHFCGLLADNRNDALKDMAQELVELLKDSHINNSRWLDVVWESECDNEIIKAVASRINLIRD
ncbi:hypothetical protein SK128_006244 [Halocaridina rubra]|uniref:NACHT domain-containing protein n=1 Tax=Halocaridina rubra TaxID=373956 RepID=A0AAN8XHG4_HALRR